jgi:hypothetical protein
MAARVWAGQLRTGACTTSPQRPARHSTHSTLPPTNRHPPTIGSHWPGASHNPNPPETRALYASPANGPTRAEAPQVVWGGVWWSVDWCGVVWCGVQRDLADNTIPVALLQLRVRVGRHPALARHSSSSLLLKLGRSVRARPELTSEGHTHTCHCVSMVVAGAGVKGRWGCNGSGRDVAGWLVICGDVM